MPKKIRFQALFWAELLSHNEADNRSSLANQSEAAI
jgi:hypothetical protein